MAEKWYSFITNPVDDFRSFKILHTESSGFIGACVWKKSLLYRQVKKSILWTSKTQKKNVWSVSIHIYQKVLWLISNLTDMLKYIHILLLIAHLDLRTPRFSQNEQAARWKTAEKLCFAFVTDESLWWLRQWNQTYISLTIF